MTVGTLFPVLPALPALCCTVGVEGKLLLALPVTEPTVPPPT
jgi:hypothetical protein